MSSKSSATIVVAAPMSFTGSLGRVRTWFNGWVFWVVGVPLLVTWWSLIACWYVIFSLMLVPYRLVRRGSRKRRLEQARHAEVLAALSRRDE